MNITKARAKTTLRRAAALASLAGLLACSTGAETGADETSSAITACHANQEEVGLDGSDDTAPIDGDDGEDLSAERAIQSPAIHILGVPEDTGCSSIEIKDPRNPPKHPPMPLPLPDDWNKRCPSYGPPESVKIDPTKCKVKNATLLTCDVPIDGRKKPITFECRRHEPGGKKKAKNEPCKFHCYVKEGQK